MRGSDRLVDWGLPLITGFEVCRRIRCAPELKALPVIMLTARGEEAEKVRALDPSRATSFVFMSGGASPEEQARVDATGVRCLTKPVELEILRALFERAD